MGKERSAEYYDKVYAGQIPGKGQQYQQSYKESQYYPLWKRVLALIEQDAILDLGCGVGHFAQACYESGIPSYEGFDFSREALHIARSHPLPVEYDFFHGDILDLDMHLWGQGKTITILETLEHIEDDILLLAQMPAGQPIVATVPMFDCDTHVRYFTEAKQVRDRYGNLIDIDTLERFQSWYIFSGKKI